MYDPKSMKAAEFINHEEILETLAYADAHKDDLAIVEGVMGLANAFRRTVIAEGVETIAHGEALLSLGCELAQGYAIARPMPADDLPT